MTTSRDSPGILFSIIPLMSWTLSLGPVIGKASSAKRDR